jgi:glucosylceramidase
MASVFGLMLLTVTNVAFALDDTDASSVSVYTTDPSAPEQYLKKSSPALLEKLPLHAAVLTYNSTHLFQSMEGFGAALTDSAILAINRLTPMVRTKLLHDLFGPQEGLNVNFLRVPIGASDFSIENYSYLDLPAGQTDPDLNAFNASRAQPTIDMIHEILEINPDVKIMLTPWSPPGWMKTSGSMINGSLKPEFFDALAGYLIKSIQAFEAQDIPISYLSIQNEPYFGNDKYASMYMTAEDQITLIRDHLGPLMQLWNVDTKILVLDHNYIYREDADRIFETTKEWVEGIAYHCYDGDIESIKGSTAPIFQTECTAIEDGTSFKSNFHDWLSTQVINGGLVGAKSALGWNIVLDKTHGPSIGYCTDCRGMVDVNLKDQTYRVNPEMIAIAHAGKFVRQGARRMETADYKSPRFSYVAYLNPGEDVVVIAENKIDKAIAVAVPDQDGHYFKVRIPAGGAVTVTIPSSFLF